MKLMPGVCRKLIKAEKLAPLVFLAVQAVIEIAWLSAHQLFFSGFAFAIATVLLLMLVSAGYGLTGRSQPLSEMAYYAAVWIMMALIGVLSTYIFATIDRPLLDDAFSRMDVALGFRWADFYHFSRRHQAVHLVLMLAYYSGLAQIFFSIIYLSHVRRTDRNDELWWASSISLAMTSILSGFFPAAGAFFHFSLGLDDAVHLGDFFALRNGSVSKFLFGDMQGIVAFPSYHTVIAILLIYAYRKLPIFPWVAGLNVLMLISTPVYGGHYLADMFSGAALAILSIYLMKCVRAFLASRSPVSQTWKSLPAP